MKKTFTINISGTIFHIEEDAYEKLQNYLLKLKGHFGNEDEGREIISDIETRIAELFLEKSKDDDKVVVMQWVEEVIATMGTPEDFMQQDADEEPLTGNPTRKRRLYRDPDNRYIGGVCSGLAAYFNMSKIAVRILFIVLFFINGIGLLAYLVLWIAVPAAKTTAQRLEMRGQEVNISNIERTIRDDVQDVKESVQQLSNSKAVSKGREAAGQAGEVAYNVSKMILRLVVVALGVFLLFFGFAGLVGLISTMIVGHSGNMGWFQMWDQDFEGFSFLSQFVTPGALTWGLISIAILAGIPLIAMLFVGSKLVFRYKSNNAAVGLGMVGIWLIALVAMVFIAAGQVSNFKSNTTLSSSETLFSGQSNTLYLDVASDPFENYNNANWSLDNFKVVFADGKNTLLGQPRINIEKSSSNECIIVVRKESRGKNQVEANENIQKIEYKYAFKDSTLTFDPWFLPGAEARFRNQQVNITLKLPEGRTVYLNDRLIDMVHDIDNISNTWDRDMVGKYWVMKPEGLTWRDAPAVSDSTAVTK